MALIGAVALPLYAAAQPLEPPWPTPAAFDPADAVRQELRQRLTWGAPDAVAAFYRARDHRPLWAPGALAPAARQALAMLEQADADGLRAWDYDAAGLADVLREAEGGDPRALAEAEVRLSAAVAAYAVDLRKGRSGVALAFADPEIVGKPLTAADALRTLAAAPTLSAGLAELRRMNPIYEKLRAALAAHRTGGGLQLAANVTPERYERLLLANLERARALPADLGERYILVDAAAGRLWLYDRGQIVTTMKVVVGKESMPTPLMAGVIRHAIFSPYWNVPEDLVQTSIAPKVLSQGLGYLQAERMEVLAGYEDDAPLLDPAQVDWKAVAAGEQTVRVRQLPGPRNMMGKVKLEFRNPLGIFLHDTPQKELFGAEVRTASSGCVRLEDALALTELLLGDTPEVGEGPEQRVDLPKPVPVYITYLTALPTRDGVILRPDVYSRDAEPAQTIAADLTAGR